MIYVYFPVFLIVLAAWCWASATLSRFRDVFRRPKVSRGTYLPPKTEDAEEYFKEYEKYLAEYRAYLIERNRVYGVKK